MASGVGLERAIAEAFEWALSLMATCLRAFTLGRCPRSMSPFV